MSTGYRLPATGYRLRGAALFATCFALSASCARVMPPPGGPRDETPPTVLTVTPAPMSTIAATDDPVVIEFEDRISEQGVEDAVFVSPVTGSVDVTNGRRSIEIEVAGGWQPNRVYRVVVQPTVHDLFNNRLERPIEIVFSTGAPFSEAAAAGIAFERVSGSIVPDVRVEAHPVGGGAYHLAITDSAGIFRMPLLPPGTYLLRGYADQNRDRRRDGFEPADSLTIEVGQTDTVLRPLALMRPDSTAANLTRVQVVDSVTLRLQFDDYMDVVEPQHRASVTVRTLPDSGAVALAGIFYPHVLTAERARQDSIARDSAAVADTTPAPPAPADTIVPGRALPTVTGDSAAAADTIPPDPLIERVRAAQLRPGPEQPLPTRELMVVLGSPLVPDAEYTVQVAGILNLAGIPEGAGTTTFRAPAAPAAPPPPAEEAEPADDESADEPAEPEAEDTTP